MTHGLQKVCVTLFPTTRCDTGCSHCCDDCNMNNPIDFTEQLAKQLIDEVIADDLDFDVFITGNGEPLQAPELLGVVDTFGAYEKTKRIGMITSGFLNKDEFRKSQLDSLLRRPYANEIWLEQSFNLFHTSFTERLENVMELMMNIRDMNFLRVRAAVSVENCQETWKGFENLIFSMFDKADDFRFAFPVGSQLGREELYFSEIYEYMQQGDKSKMDIKIESWMIPRLYFLKNKSAVIGLKFVPIPLNRLGRARKTQMTCWDLSICEVFREFDKADRVYLNIRPDGSVYPECSCNAKHMVLGKIGVDSLSDIISRKRSFTSRIGQAMIADRRIFSLGSSDNVCTLCQYLVAERGFEL